MFVCQVTFRNVPGDQFGIDIPVEIEAATKRSAATAVTSFDIDAAW